MKALGKKCRIAEFDAAENEPFPNEYVSSRNQQSFNLIYFCVLPSRWALIDDNQRVLERICKIAPTDVFFSNVLADVHLFETVHICSPDDGNEMVWEHRFHVCPQDVLCEHFSS